MNNGFEDRLRESLAEQNNNIEIEGAGPAAAAVRATERAQRTSIGRGLASMAVVLGLGAMAYTQFAGDGDQLIAAEENTTLTTIPYSDSESAAAIPGVDFTASSVGGQSHYFRRFLTDEGQLIQVTTKPGLSMEELNSNDFPKVVTVSDSNGVVEVNDLPDDFAATSFAYHDGLLFSVSTSPASGPRDVALVNRSSDNGRSWNTATIDLAPVLSADHIGVWQNANIAANNAGVLVTVETSYWTNYEALLPQYVYSGEGETYYDIRPTETGVEVRDWTEHSRWAEEQYAECGYPDQLDREPTEEELTAAEECWSQIEELPEPDPIAVYTWDDLGIEAVPNTSQTEMFYSADGLLFEKVSLPVEDASPYVMGNDSGFLLQSYGTYDESQQLNSSGDGSADHEFIDNDWQARWFASNDGRAWDEIDGPPGNCGVTPGGGAVFVSQSCDSNNAIYLSSDGGRSWSETAPIPVDAPEGYLNYSSIYAGEMGLVAVAHTEPDYMLLEEAMMEASDQGLSPDEMRDIEQGFEEDDLRKTEMFFSADGASWSLLETPAELQDEKAWINDAVIGKNRIVVSFGIESLEGYSTKDVFLTPN